MNEQKNGNFLLHGGILAIASILVRFIGMIYRIPMVNIIGREGTGYYSVAYSVYTILLLLSSYSMPLAISKMVSARVAKGKWRETKNVLKVGMVFGVVVGLSFALVTFFCADFFCTKIMRSPKSAIALKVMAPTVFIMALLGVLRGFFQGLQTTIPTALSQVFEQIVNAVVSVVMAMVLFKKGSAVGESLNDPSYAAAYGAAGGTIGTGAGALFALMFCVFVYSLYKSTLDRKADRDKHRESMSNPELMGAICLIAVPVILSTAAHNCVDIIDSAVFNNAMRKLGYSVEEYTAIWGDYNSAFLLLIHLPVAFSSAISSALIPSLSAAFEEDDDRQVYKKISLAMRVTFLISIPFAFGMMSIGGNLAKLLFADIADEARTYLVVGGLSVVFFSVATVSGAILQGIDRMRKPVVNAIVALFVHTVILFVFLFVFKLGAVGVIISYMFFGLVLSLLNVFSIYRITGYIPDPIKNIALPTIASLIMSVICLLVAFVMSRLTSGKLMNLFTVVFGFIFGAIIYIYIILSSGCLTKNQLKELPGGRKILKFCMKYNIVS